MTGGGASSVKQWASEVVAVIVRPLPLPPPIPHFPLPIHLSSLLTSYSSPPPPLSTLPTPFFPFSRSIPSEFIFPPPPPLVHCHPPPRSSIHPSLSFPDWSPFLPIQFITFWAKLSLYVGRGGEVRAFIHSSIFVLPLPPYHSVQNSPPPN